MSSFVLVEHGTTVEVASSDSEYGELPSTPTKESKRGTFLIKALVFAFGLLLIVLTVAVLVPTMSVLNARTARRHTIAEMSFADASPRSPHAMPDVYGRQNKADNVSIWRSDAVLSIQQACAVEIAAHCATRRHHGRVECLLQHYYTNKEAAQLSPVCQTWLDAREACAEFLRAPGNDAICRASGRKSNRNTSYAKADTSRHLRECLRHADPDLLPPSCVKSDYYASVKLFGRLRAEKHRGPHREHLKREMLRTRGAE